MAPRPLNWHNPRLLSFLDQGGAQPHARQPSAAPQGGGGFGIELASKIGGGPVFLSDAPTPQPFLGTDCLRGDIIIEIDGVDVGNNFMEAVKELLRPNFRTSVNLIVKGCPEQLDIETSTSMQTIRL